MSKSDDNVVASGGLLETVSSDSSSGGSGSADGLTRRGVLIGAGSAGVAYATTPANADAADPTGWDFAFSPDPVHPDRKTATIRCRSKTALLVLRETAFGERARFTDRPSPEAKNGPGDPPDRRLVVSGAQLVAGSVFTLFFDFSSLGDVLTLDVSASGWEFGGSAGNPTLLASGSLSAVTVDAGLKVYGSNPKAADKLAEALNSAVFGSLARRKGKPKTPLGVWFSIRAGGARAVWTLAAVDAVDAFLVPLGPDGASGAGTTDNVILRASSISMWRRIDPPPASSRATIAGVTTGGAKPGIPGDVMDDAETGTGAARKRPRTVAIFGCASLSDETVLGTVGRDDGTESFLRLSGMGGASLCDRGPRWSFTPRLVRTSDGPNKNERITADIPVAGRLEVVNKALNGEAFEEGPFHAVGGRLSISMTPGAQNIDVSASFELSGKVRSVVTAWAAFALSAPDQCGTCDLTAPASSAKATIADGRITAFEIVGRVFDAGVSIPEDATRLVPTGMPSRSFASRLDFPGGLEVLFRLRGAPDEANEAPALGFVTMGLTRGFVSAPASPNRLFRLPMEGGVLRVTRWADLMTLTFRFVGLDLAGEAGEKGAAFALRARGRARVSAPPPVRRADGGLLDDVHLKRDETCEPARSEIIDTRPMMVVEFPPQHVAEQAFFTRRKPRPNLPEPPVLNDAGRELILAPVRVLRTTYGKNASNAEKRLQARLAIKAIYLDPKMIAASPAATPATPAAGAATAAQETPVACPLETPTSYENFAKDFAAKAGAEKLPKEQQVYIGSEWLDFSARVLAEQVAKAGKLRALPDELPEDPVDAFEQAAIRADLEGLGCSEKTLLEEIDSRRRARDPFFVEFKSRYDASGEGGAYKAKYSVYFGRADLQEKLSKETDWCLEKNENFEQFTTLIAGLIKQVSEALNVTSVEAAVLPAKARLSGASRLAYRINFKDRDKGPADDAIPFRIDSLTNWGDFELAVVRRAEKLFEPKSDGSQRPSDDRREDADFFRQLQHQGFSTGGLLDDPKCSLARRLLRIPSDKVSAVQRLAEVAARASAPPTDLETAIEIPFRLTLSPSQDARFRTRRQVPEKLFGTSKGPAAVTDKLLETSKDAWQRTEADPLWTADYDPNGDARLRAVWSPDFRPEAFLARETDAVTVGERSNRAPLRGPYAPWNLPRGLSTSSMKFEELSEAVKKLTPFRTSLDAFDRHELVALSSLHGLPVLGRRTPEGGRVGVDQREPPAGFKVGGLKGTKPADGDPSIPQDKWPDFNDIYVPRPLPAEELALSSLGGFLTLDADFEPPAAARLKNGQSLFDALSIERWKHRIVLGRDISAEVLYKGYLFPIGLRAALVKITERRFERVSPGGPPVAVLRQRMFLRVAKPVKEFPAFRQPNGGRRFPFAQVELITTQSPDIVDPFDYSGEALDDVKPSGLIDLKGIALRLGAKSRNQASDATTPAADAQSCKGGAKAAASAQKPKDAPAKSESSTSGTAFWPRTARRPGAEAVFDVALATATTRIPLIFVDNVAVNNDASMKALCAYYNGLSPKDARPAWKRLVTAPLGGAKVRYAPELKPGDTEFETATITLSAEGQATNPAPGETGYDPYAINADYEVDAFMQGLDQPPFYPAIKRASVKVGQIERLAGQAVGPVDVAYDATYTIFGFDGPAAADNANAADMPRPKNPRDIYLDLLSQGVDLKFGGSGDRGGGVGRPELNVVALSRSRGVVGSDKPDNAKEPEKSQLPAVAQALNEPVTGSSGTRDRGAAEFFSGSAKLLGVVTFKQLLELVVGKFEPQLKEIVDYGSGLVDQGAGAIKSGVLEPLAELIIQTRERLGALSVDGAGTAQSALDAAYPELSAALTALEDAVNAALAAPPPSEGDPVGTLSAYSAVYEAGRRFVDAALRVARDPITPLRAAAEKSLQDKFAAIAKDIPVADVLKTFERLRGIEGRRALRNMLRDTLLMPLSDGIFALPPSDVTVAAALEPKLQAEINAAIKSALRSDAPWPGVEAPDKPFFDQNEFAKALKDELRSRALDDLEDALKAQSDAILGRLDGYLWPVVDQALSAAQTAAQVSNSADIVKLFDYVTALGGKVDAARQTFEQLKDLPGFADATCMKGAGALADFLRMAAPVEGTSSGPTAKPDDTYFTGPYAIYPAIYRLKRGLDRVDDYAGQLEPKVAGELLQKLQSLRAAVVAPQAKLKALESQLEAGVRALDRAVDQFAAAISVVRDELSKAKGCSDAGGAAMQFLRVLPTLADGVDEARRPLVAAVADAAGMLADLLAAPFGKTVATSNGAPSSAIDYLADWSEWNERWDVPANVDDAFQTVRLMVVGLAAPAVQAALGLLGQLTTIGAFIDQTLDEGFAAKQAAAKELEKRFVDFDEMFAPRDGDSVGRKLIKAQWAEIKKAYVGDAGTPTVVRQIAKTVETKLQDGLKLKAAIDARNLKDAEDVVKKLVASVDAPALPEPREVANRLLGVAVDGGVAYGTAILRTTIEAQKEALEARGLALLSSLLFDVQKVHAKLLGEAYPVARSLATALRALFGYVKDQRDALLTKIGDGVLSAKLKRLLIAATDEAGDPAKDNLNKQLATLDAILADFRNDNDKDKDKKATDALITLISGWREGGDPKKANAVLVILTQVQQAGDELLRGNVAAVIDVDSVRRDIESRLKQMIPSKITLAYDFKTDLTTEVAGGLFRPGPKSGSMSSTLELTARTVTDVLNGGATQTSVIGELGPFSIKLLPAFDIVTLYFNGARYTNGVDGGGKFSVQFGDFEFGQMAKFLEELGTYVSFGDSGFFLALRSDIPKGGGGFDFGIEAGYRMAPINLSIGTLSFMNVSLNASCILPFGDSEATFKVGVSRPEAPFLITAFPFGGSGHLALYASAKGIIGFEAAFAFGAAGAFAFGPLVGQGFVMAGIFMRNIKLSPGDETASTLEGYFVAAGSARISCFSTSTSLTIKFGQQPSGKMAGSAVFTFSFSLGVKDIEFRFTAYKEEGKGFSSPRQASIIDVSPIRYAEVTLTKTDAPAPCPAGGRWPDRLKPVQKPIAKLTSQAVCKGKDFAKYQSYFSDLEPWGPI